MTPGRITGAVMRSMSLLSWIRLEFVVEAECKRHAATITAALGITSEFSQVRVPSRCSWAPWEPEKQTQDSWQWTVSSTSQPKLNHSATTNDRLQVAFLFPALLRYKHSTKYRGSPRGFWHLLQKEVELGSWATFFYFVTDFIPVAKYFNHTLCEFVSALQNYLPQHALQKLKQKDRVKSWNMMQVYLRQQPSILHNFP